MVTANIKATFQCKLQKVWNTVTSLDNYSWRSDLSRIEILSETKFVEYAKNGYSTTFAITVNEPLKRWEFDMENSNMKGRWVGLFTQSENETTIDFAEHVTVKKWFIKPFVKGYLKKQQKIYLADLKKELMR